MELTGSVSGNINLGGSGGGGLDDVLVKKTTDYESVVENDKAYIDLSWVASKTSLADYVTLEDMTDYYDKIEVDGLLNQKQDKLTAGDNITINNNVISASGGGGLDDVLGTASGEIASFNDGADKSMPALKVGIEPIQEGSGDPSPENVRPIIGHTEANVVVSPTTDAEDGTTYNIQFKDGDNPLTVYGGTLDVVSGVLTVDRAEIDLGSRTYNKADDGYFYTYISDISIINFNANAPTAECEIYKLCTSDEWYGRMIDCGIFGVESSHVIYIADTRFSDGDSLKTALAGKKLVYTLATPQTIQLTPTQVKSLLGTNNIWADTGDVVEAVYVKDFNKVINMLVDKTAYSTEEKQIGTWIDGKPLYRRSFILTASNLNNSPFVTDIPSNIIDNIWIDASATFIKTADNSGSYISAVGYWNPANNFDCRLQTNEQYINLQTWRSGGMNYQDGSILTLIYTKR